MRLINIIFLMLISISTNAQYTVEKAVSVVSQQKFYINSATNISGRTRIVIPIKLPPNTIRWYYSFSASRNEADIEEVQNNFNLLAKLTYLIDETGTTATALSQLNKPPGSNYCDVYLLQPEYIRSFEAKGNFYYDRLGSQENYVSGLKEITHNSRNGNIQYLGFRNPDLMHGINILLDIVAIVNE